MSSVGSSSNCALQPITASLGGGGGGEICGDADRASIGIRDEKSRIYLEMTSIFESAEDTS